jgi:hypothetical protein
MTHLIPDLGTHVDWACWAKTSSCLWLYSVFPFDVYSLYIYIHRFCFYIQSMDQLLLRGLVAHGIKKNKKIKGSRR